MELEKITESLRNIRVKSVEAEGIRKITVDKYKIVSGEYRKGIVVYLGRGDKFIKNLSGGAEIDVVEKFKGKRWEYIGLCNHSTGEFYVHQRSNEREYEKILRRILSREQDRKH